MSRISGNLNVQQDLQVGGSISVGSGNIDADRLQHIHKIGTSFGKMIDDTPVSDEITVFVASTSGTVRNFKALFTVTGTTTATSTFDLEKNGTSVLSAAVEVDKDDTDNTPVVGTVTTTTFVADDVFTMKITVSDTTGGTVGPFCWAEFEENAG